MRSIFTKFLLASILCTANIATPSRAAEPNANDILEAYDADMDWAKAGLVGMYSGMFWMNAFLKDDGQPMLCPPSAFNRQTGCIK